MCKPLSSLSRITSQAECELKAERMLTETAPFLKSRSTYMHCRCLLQHTEGSVQDAYQAESTLHQELHKSLPAI